MSSQFFNSVSSSKNSQTSSSILPEGRNSQPSIFTNRITNANVQISPLSERYPTIITSPVTSPSTPKSSLLSNNQVFAHKSKKLLGLLTDTKSILERFREINKEKWNIQYPFLGQTLSNHRQFTSYDDNDLQSSMTSNWSAKNSHVMSEFRQQIQAKLYTPPQQDMSSSQEINTKLNVFRLNLKQGDSSSAENVMEQLDKSAVSKLLDCRLVQGIKRIENLESRVADTSSKVLVAGDVNAGKSTFVNALLRRNVMPVDQQPCTTLFCEVLDVQENSGIEEVHAIKNIESYNREDSSTYTKIELSNLFDTVNNGLNRDTLKTTALFARQEEIDVIIFVVSAENHFTLSAKEFLSNASNEKAYLFIVVNRFDNIRDKEKCKRLVLDQIKEVSPRTYEHAEDLVHFVTSTTIPIERQELNDKSNVSATSIDKQRIDDFNRLEESLRNFVLKKRSKSKLSPARHYIDNILNDIGVLSEFNRGIASREAEKSFSELESGREAFERLCNDEKYITLEANKCVDDTCDSIMLFTKKRLEDAISNIDLSATNIEYRGLIYVWAYASDVRDAMLEEISKGVYSSEQKAKEETANCINRIQSIAENLGGEPCKIDLEKMYRHGIINTIPIALSDFFDFDITQNFNDRFSFVGLSSCTIIYAFSKFNALSSLWKIYNFTGIFNIRGKTMLSLVGIAGIGVCTYLLYDMGRVIPRKVAKKIKHELVQSQYIDHEANRITRQSRKKIRLATEDLRTRFRIAVEEQKQNRITMEHAFRKSENAVNFFEDVFNKAEKMSEVLNSLGNNWEDSDDELYN
ncbi:7769_t:CDS:2 [Cetraspora pellucida]|uniref:7769_t:CDS:1 n=1 Tax=Cetraspora pellucida TaxID=1433469 RepID=A0A9N8ZZV0_9GLOM|nr:7769_t:CDS:2 [Cetraspora pellucida]